MPFEARISMVSGRRSYTKRVEVIALNLKRWSTPDGSRRRVYIDAVVEDGTSTQRGIYPLAYLFLDGGQMRYQGGERGQSVTWMDYPEEIRCELSAAALSLLTEGR
jgi:hypothetical protein